jgi:23S rRNA pseudouridine2605 synthase
MPDEPRIVPMRLQKFLARAGVASRRGSEDLMTAGRVAVNGEIVAMLGAKVDPATDIVTVDGIEVRLSDGPVYVVLHKPVGFLTTMDDPQGRPSIRELVPADEYPGLFPVGRLDKDTTGLLLFTTDGELGFRLLHPRFHVAKTYEATVDGLIAEESLARLRAGIELDDGPTRPAEVRLLAHEGATSRVEITISEGRKRQVRRMFGALGHPVLELHRITFGPLSLGDTEPGAWRHASPEEVAALRQAGAQYDTPDEGEDPSWPSS